VSSSLGGGTFGSCSCLAEKCEHVCVCVRARARIFVCVCLWVLSVRHGFRCSYVKVLCCILVIICR